MTIRLQIKGLYCFPANPGTVDSPSRDEIALRELNGGIASFYTEKLAEIREKAAEKGITLEIEGALPAEEAATWAHTWVESRPADRGRKLVITRRNASGHYCLHLLADTDQPTDSTIISKHPTFEEALGLCEDWSLDLRGGLLFIDDANEGPAVLTFKQAKERFAGKHQALWSLAVSAHSPRHRHQWVSQGATSMLFSSCLPSNDSTKRMMWAKLVESDRHCLEAYRSAR